MHPVGLQAMSLPMRPSSEPIHETSDPTRPRYLEPAKPLVFPESAAVPETQLHLDLRTLLYLLLSDYLGEDFIVGSDQFVYWDASNPQCCVAPDVYVKRARRGEPVRSWKVWERGAPDVAVEIVSDSDSAPGGSSTKVEQYHALGVKELVRLDLVSPTGPQLRVWNRVEDRLLERVVERDTVASVELLLHWTVAPAKHMPHTLRVASSVQPLELIPTADEARQAEARARQVEARARQAAESARSVSETRVAELEAQLALERAKSSKSV
jgi:Uma2 family endonuclease